MTIASLLRISREIWGPKNWGVESLGLKAHGLSAIIINLGVVFGDICRWRRDKYRGMPHEELQKELGNVILSTIRWCDDLGFDPELCIERAIMAQRRFADRLLAEKAGSSSPVSGSMEGPSEW